MTTENEPTKKTRRLIVVKKPGGNKQCAYHVEQLFVKSDLLSIFVCLLIVSVLVDRAETEFAADQKIEIRR